MADKVEKRPMTAADWDMARALFIRGETVEEILKHLPDVKISKSRMYEVFTKEGVMAKKKAMQARVIDDMVTLTEAEKLNVNQRCIRLYNEGAEIIDGLLGKYKKELNGKDVAKNQAKATAYNIDMLMSGVTKIQKGLRVAYGMDDQGRLYEKEPDVLVIEGVDTGKI